MTLERLALSRSTLDRAAHRRADPALLDDLLADSATAVLLLYAERAAVLDAADGPALAMATPKEALAVAAGSGLSTDHPNDPDHPDHPDLPEGVALSAFLGQDADRRAYLLLALPSGPPSGPLPTPVPAVADPVAVPLPQGQRWAGLRELGSVLDDTGAGLLTASVALANWHAGHPRCSRCGGATEVIQAGWARRCPACDAEHYPRTDPAVIMAVIDGDDRIMLGRQARWPAKRFSTLAGFVEPGESLEAAVRREVFEEASVVIGEVEYRGSQPWPFPSSLMLGFRAYPRDGGPNEPTVDGEELAQARWWTREELALDVATEELLLPPPVSIARRLIEDWYGGPLSDRGGAWR